MKPRRHLACQKVKKMHALLFMLKKSPKGQKFCRHLVTCLRLKGHPALEGGTKIDRQCEEQSKGGSIRKNEKIRGERKEAIPAKGIGPNRQSVVVVVPEEGR